MTKNLWIESSLNSYGQVFFSLHKGFGLLLLAATMLDVQTGLFGLGAVLLINAIAKLLGFADNSIREGVYGFNAVLLGLCLGKQFIFSGALLLFAVFSVLLLLLITVGISSSLAAKGLPFLSLPFIVTYWVVALAARHFHHLQFNDADIFYLNTQAQYQTSVWYAWVHSLDGLQLPELIYVYFKTLSSTFFQSSLLSGILVAVGLLLASRIAFGLSVIGLFAAYFFYQVLGADVLGLTYFLVGSNYIFLAVAVGSFYLVPNLHSHLSAVLLIPVLLFMLMAVNQVFALIQLPTFTLAFSSLVIIFVFALKHRWIHRFMHLVQVQYYSPEKTIYKHVHQLKRFANAHLAKIYLPFWGDWQVSQGYDGKITHLGDWSKALDFVVIDSELKTYQTPGSKKEDFYCFDKPVVAPADGYIYDITNNSDDNDIANVDTDKNWGNTLIINHTNGLFTQLSHIKKDSFKVKIGDYVTRGTVLATCGNSGRSPEPHLHFQLQLTPIVGAKTLAYPLAYFIEKSGNKKSLKIAEVPQEGTLVSNIETNSLLAEAFGWLPNMKIAVQSSLPRHQRQTTWYSHTDAYNRSYLHCPVTGSVAYYVNDGTMFYFTDFEGDKNSALFQFYLAAYKVLLGFYKDISLQDQLPLHHFSHWLWRWIQDFAAPFVRFSRVDYQMRCDHLDNDFSPTVATIESAVNVRLLGKNISQQNFTLSAAQDKSITLHSKNQSIKIQCVGY